MEENRLKSCVQAVIRKRGDGENNPSVPRDYVRIKDSFRSLLAFGTILGLIPLKTLYSCRCSFLSYVYPVLIVVFIITCFVLLFLAHNPLVIWKLEEIATVIIILGSTVHGILAVLTSTLGLDHIYELFNSLELIEPLIGTKNNHRKWRRKLITIVIGLIVINFLQNLQFVFQLSKESGSLSHVELLSGLFMFYLYFLTFLPVTILLFCSQLFKAGFEILDEALQNVLREDPLDSFALLQIRLLHNYFCSLIGKLNETLALKLLTFFTAAVLEICISIYLSIFTDGPKRISWVLKSVVLYSWMAWTCGAAESISNKAALSIKTLCKISGWKLNSDIRFQIHLFISNMTCLPLDITASNYFVIKRQLLTTLTSIITSYVIILIQFRLGIGKVEMIH